MTLRELINRIGFQIQDKELKTLDKTLNNVKNGALAIGAAFAASTTALVGFVYATANSAREAKLASQRYGISTDAIQEYGYVAKRSGIDVSELTTSIRFLNRNIVNLGGNKKLNEIFTKFHINTKKANGELKKADEILPEIADVFQKLPDGAEKTALSMQIFGRAGVIMIPLLNKGAQGINELRQQAHDLGLVLDEDTIKLGVEFKGSISVLQAFVKGLSFDIGKRLLPAAVDIAKQIVEWAIANRKLISTKINQFMDVLIGFVETGFSVIKSLVGWMWRLVESIGGVDNALRLLFIVVAWFVALQLVNTVSALITIFVGLAKAIRLAGLWQMFLNGAAMLLPAILAAILVLVGLLIEDFMVWMDGGNSVLKLLYERFGELSTGMQIAIGIAGVLAAVLLAAFLGPLAVIPVLVAAFLLGLDKMRGHWGDVGGEFMRLWEDISIFVNSIFDVIIKNFEAAVTRIKTAIENVKSAYEKARNIISGDPRFNQQPITSSNAPASVPGGKSTTNAFSISAPISVSVSGGNEAYANQTAESVRSVVRDEFNKTINHALENYGGE